MCGGDWQEEVVGYRQSLALYMTAFCLYSKNVFEITAPIKQNRSLLIHRIPDLVYIGQLCKYGSSVTHTNCGAAKIVELFISAV